MPITATYLYAFLKVFPGSSFSFFFFSSSIFYSSSVFSSSSSSSSSFFFGSSSTQCYIIYYIFKTFPVPAYAHASINTHV